MSIESQKRELEKTFLSRDDIEIVGMYEESFSAKAPGRRLFNEMLDKIEKGKADGIIAWHPDRLARNSVDGGRIIYLLDTGKLKDLKFATFTFENNPQGKFMLSIIFGSSKYYVDSLSENVRRGNRTKLENGWIPTHAPIGYLNDEKSKTIVIDPERFSIVRRIWDLMLSGTYSPSVILEMAASQLGLRTKKTKRRGGKPLALSSIYRLLNSPFYAGIILWKGNRYPGKHAPMITLAEWETVQKMIRRVDRPRPKSRSFAYTGLMHCGECGMSITAEESINRFGSHYIYYHCTKKRRGYRCRQPYISLVDLEHQMLSFLEGIKMPDRYHQWAVRQLDKMRSKEGELKTQQLRSLEEAIQGTSHQLDNLTRMRARDLLTDEEYLAQRKKLQMEQFRLNEGLRKSQQSHAWLEPLFQLISFSHSLNILFKKGSGMVRREILEIVGSNLLLTDGKVRIDAKKPFSLWSSFAYFPQLSALVDEVRTLQTEDPSFSETIVRIKRLLENVPARRSKD